MDTSYLLFFFVTLFTFGARATGQIAKAKQDRDSSSIGRGRVRERERGRQRR